MHTRPGSIRDHWKQAIYMMRGDSVNVAEGDEVSLRAAHDDDDVWFACSELKEPGLVAAAAAAAAAGSTSRAGAERSVPRPICTCGAHAAFTPDYFWAALSSPRVWSHSRRCL